MNEFALKNSLQAVRRLLRGQKEECPTCFGAKALVSYIRGTTPSPKNAFLCPTCKGKGTVTWPVYGLECYIGGWDCCPVCGEGQHSDPSRPCKACRFWMVM